eukprot:TRINITY_DN27661_c0_g1_i1.p1 TRINITY_DN27661_c0_g1~~TRINITY_DN27661_c0_g1_i1.p1  ORF type:complete len:1422 (+),score=418.40 TRINITY_DN27661_c0_g1_i1:88-4266(+)
MAAPPAQLKYWKSSLRSPRTAADSPQRSCSASPAALPSPAAGSPIPGIPKVSSFRKSRSAGERSASPGRQGSVTRAASGSVTLSPPGAADAPRARKQEWSPQSITLVPSISLPPQRNNSSQLPYTRVSSLPSGLLGRRASAVPERALSPASGAQLRSRTPPAAFAPPGWCAEADRPRFMRATRSLQAERYVDGAGFVDRSEYHEVVRWPDARQRSSSAGARANRVPTVSESPRARGMSVAFGANAAEAFWDARDMAAMALDAYAWESDESLTFEEFLTMLDDIEPDSEVTTWFTKDVFTLVLRGRGRDEGGMAADVLADIFNEWFHHDIKVMSRLHRHLESRSQDSKSLRSIKSTECDAPHYMRPTKSFIRSSEKLKAAQEAKDDRRRRRLERIAERERRKAAARSPSGRRKRQTRSPRRHEDDWRPGDAVLIRDSEAEPWKQGVVKGFSDGRPLVQPKGYSKAHHWRFVRKHAAKEDAVRRPCGVEGATKALLIGIDYVQDAPGHRPPPDAELCGCSQDMRRLARMMKRKGLNYEQRMLADDIDKCLPVRHAILEGLRWLVSGSQKGDCLFFAFSGRNGYKLPCDPRPEDARVMEALAPLDYAQRGLISGAEIARILFEGMHPESRLVAIVDCPQGGGIMQLPFQLTAERDGRFGLSEADREEGPAIFQIDTTVGEPKRTRLALGDPEAADHDDGAVESGLISAWVQAQDHTPDPLLMPLLSELRGLLKGKLGGDCQLPRLSATRRVDLGDRFTLGFTVRHRPRFGGDESPPPSPSPRGGVTLTEDALRLAARQAALQQAKGNRPRMQDAFNWRGMFGWLPPPYSARDGRLVQRRAPDYSAPQSWVCNFAMGVGQDIQRWFPQTASSSPHRHRPEQVPREADCFFVHPTTVELGWGGADFDEQPQLTQDVVQQMASTFAGCCRLYAPKYRQARFQAYSSPAGGEFSPQGQFDTAYGDVRRAWEHYLAKNNPLGPSGRRPIVLAGHGQGSQHLVRLLSEQPSERALVCAYLIGWHVGEDALGHRLPFGRAPLQTRCWVSFSTGDPVPGDPERPAAYGLRGTPPAAAAAACAQCTRCPLAVNPLSWRAEPKLVDAARHRGALRQDGSLSEVGVLSARLQLSGAGAPEVRVRVARSDHWREVVGEDGSRDKRRSWQAMKLSSLHELDYHLFWGNIRENAEARVRAWVPPFLRHALDGGDFVLLHHDQVLCSPEQPKAGDEVRVEQRDTRGKPYHHRWRFVPVTQEGEGESSVAWGHIETRTEPHLVLDAGARSAQRRELTEHGEHRSQSPRDDSPGSPGSPRSNSPRRGAYVCLWPPMKGRAAGRTNSQLWRIVRVDAGQRLVEVESRGGGRLLQLVQPRGSPQKGQPGTTRVATARRQQGGEARQRFVLAIAK